MPYAGGSSAIYNRWKESLSHNIELMPIELAGRGVRINEPLYNRRSDAVNDVFSLVEKHLTRDPYMIFGHSMGALMTFELAHKIKESGLPNPSHLFFSGASAPHLRDERKKYHLLSPEEFEKEVLSLGGTPPEFFEHRELLEMFLPILRNDFKMAETELSNHIKDQLNVDFTVFQGKEDDLTQEQFSEWHQHTDQKFDIHYFEGGHFFLNDEVKSITNIINGVSQEKLKQVLNRHKT